MTRINPVLILLCGLEGSLRYDEWDMCCLLRVTSIMYVYSMCVCMYVCM